MPQFDVSSFGIQLISLLLGFLAFYFYFTWKYLPYSAFLLKTRKKHISSSYLQDLNFEDYAIALKKKDLKLSSLKNTVFFH